MESRWEVGRDVTLEFFFPKPPTSVGDVVELIESLFSQVSEVYWGGGAWGLGVRCDSVRCDGVRCDSVRCDSVRHSDLQCVTYESSTLL